MQAVHHQVKEKGKKVKTYIVKRLQVCDDLGETHGLRLTHGVYADEEVLRSAIALCYNEPTAELLRDLLTEFECEVCGIPYEPVAEVDANFIHIDFSS